MKRTKATPQGERQQQAQGERRGQTDEEETETWSRHCRFISLALCKKRCRAPQYEAGDKHQQALLQGLGLHEESKTVNCAAMNEEEIEQEEDEDILEAATLNYMLLDRSHGQYQAKGGQTSRQVFERSGRASML